MNECSVGYGLLYVVIKEGVLRFLFQVDVPGRAREVWRKRTDGDGHVGTWGALMLLVYASDDLPTRGVGSLPIRGCGRRCHGVLRISCFIDLVERVNANESDTGGTWVQTGDRKVEAVEWLSESVR